MSMDKFLSDRLDVICQESPLEPEDKQKLMDALEAAAQALSKIANGERS